MTMKFPFRSKGNALSDTVDALNALNTRLGASRNAFLAKKAERDHFEATLVKSSPGESNAEKVMNAKATSEWLNFHKILNRLEAEYEFFKLQFRVLELEYQAQYLEQKLDQGMIRKEDE